MPPEFRGKVVLVTGVGRVGQIGHAVARGFGRAGAQLVIADVNATGLADRAKEFAAEGFAVHAVAGDLTTPDAARRAVAGARERFGGLDRKSTRLNSSHSQISYAVFCLKKKQIDKYTPPT